MKGIIGKKKIEYKINSYCIVKILSKFIVLIFTKRNHY